MTSASAESAARRSLTPLQRRFVAAQLRDPSTPAMNMGLLVRFDDIDIERLAAAFDRVVASSDVLRGRLREVQVNPQVHIASAAEAASTVVELDTGDVEDWAREQTRRPFDLAQGFCRSLIASHRDGSASWLVVNHHIATDATALSMVVERTVQTYLGSDPPTSTFYDWVDQLDEADPMAGRVGVDGAAAVWDGAGHDGKVTRTSVGHELNAHVAAAIASDYRLLTNEMALTALLVTASATLLARDGAPSACFGIPVHHRTDLMSSSVIGPTMNLAPLEIDLDPIESCRALHRRVSRALMTTLAHAHPLAASATEFTAVINVISRAKVVAPPELPFTVEWVATGSIDRDHHFEIQATNYANTEVGIDVVVDAPTDSVHVKWTRALQHVIEEPDLDVVAYDVIDAQRVAELRRAEAGPPISGPSVLLGVALRDQLAGRAEVVAEHDGRSWTGSELWEWVEACAALLRRETEPRERIAVELDRSVEALVLIYASLVTGRSFVPLHTADPLVRRDELCERAGVARRFSELAEIRAALDHPNRKLAPGPPAADESVPAPNDEAYLLFTSGSTGAPKGVPIRQQALADYVRFATEAYFDTDAPYAPLFTALTFDLTITTLFAPVLVGGKLRIVGDDGIAGLRAVASDTSLTWLKATPSHLQALVPLVPEDHQLATAVVGGEALTARLVTSLRMVRPAIRVFNEYGPTEAVVGCCVFEVGSTITDDPFPIGWPIPNVRLRVVNGQLRHCDFGEPGELLICHPGLTDGYLDGVEAERFVFIDDERWYRSGDRVVRTDDGALTYIGRIDSELKLGGRRFDPSEIERRLEAHPAIRQVAVGLRALAPSAGSLVSDDQARLILTAWIVTNDGESVPSTTSLTRFGRMELPAWAVPRAFVAVETLPLTINGKVDVDGLPPPTAGDTASASTAGDGAPRTELERSIGNRWCATLGLDHVGIDDDFFALGGDSLSAITMLLDLSAELAIPISDEIFEHSTIRTLAVAVEAARTSSSAPPVRPVNPEKLDDWATNPPELSSVELAMRYESEATPGRTQLNVGRHIDLRVAINPEQLERAVHVVSARHAALRWTHGDPRRYLSDDRAVSFAVRPNDREPLTEAEVQDFVRQPFDLVNGPVLRVLVDHRVETSSVVIAMHHACADKQSLDVLWSEIDASYHHQGLPEIGIDTPDFRAWQMLDWSRHLTWFETQFHEPAHEPRPLRQLSPTDDGLLHVETEIAGTELDYRSGGLPASIALAAAASALAPWHEGTVDLCLIASTRDHPAARDLVGYLLNPLPLRIGIDPAAALSQLHEHSRNVLSTALSRRSVPYAEVNAHLRKAGLTPPAARFLVSVLDHEPASFGGTSANHRTVFTGEAVADLSFFVQRSGDEVALSIEFNGQAVGEDTAQVILRRFRAAFEALHRERAISVRELARPEERSLATAEPAAAHELVLDTIIRQTNERAEAAAVQCEQRRITWRQLGSRAAQVAAELERRGVVPGDHVLVQLQSSESVAIAMLGVLAHGAAYTPLDPTHPIERRRSIAVATGAVVLISDGGDTGFVEESISLGVDSIADAGWRDDLSLVANAAIDAGSPAYAIFTSGSTGEPNGVAITHGQITASTRARDVVYDTEPERFLLLSSPAFDSSLVGQFWTMACGGTLIVAPGEQAADPDAIVELISSSRPTHLLCVPTLYRLMLERAQPGAPWVDHAIVAGEACHRELVDQHFNHAPASGLTNEYGPTECTIWATSHHCDPDERGPVPIGTPLPGTWIAAVDESGYVCDDGVPGQLIVGGPLVCDGYLGGNNNERFDWPIVGLPFSSAPNFATGDRVVMHGGCAWFLGRSTEQLNVGGVRVEPGEIEVVLERMPGVANVAVVASDRRSLEEMIDSAGAAELAGAMSTAAASSEPHTALRARLEGYGTPRSVIVAHIEGTGIDESALRAAANRSLPRGARPAEYVIHESLPRGVTGKIDRRALRQHQPVAAPPVVREAAITRQGVGQVGADEVAAVFAEVLGVGAVAADMSFFDAGGDSLAAFEVVRRLEALFDQRISLRLVHENETAVAVAQALTASSATAIGSLVDDLVARPLGAHSSGERNAFFLHHIGPGGVIASSLADALGADCQLTTLIDARAVHMPYERPRSGTRFVSVTELSVAYADEIERLQPRGVLIVIGFCQGGIYAHEVVAELEQRGRDVSLLVCIRDWHAPDGGHVPIQRSTGFARLVIRTVEQLLGRRQSFRAFFGAKGRRLLAYASAAARVATPWSRTRAVGEQTFADHEAHVFTPHAVRTLIVRSSEDPYTPLELDQQGWASVLSNYRVSYVQGDPSMGSTVADVAALIRSELDDA